MNHKGFSGELKFAAGLRTDGIGDGMVLFFQQIVDDRFAADVPCKLFGRFGGVAQVDHDVAELFFVGADFFAACPKLQLQNPFFQLVFYLI